MKSWKLPGYALFILMFGALIGTFWMGSQYGRGNSLEEAAYDEPATRGLADPSWQVGETFVYTPRTWEINRTGPKLLDISATAGEGRFGDRAVITCTLSESALREIGKTYSIVRIGVPEYEISTLVKVTDPRPPLTLMIPLDSFSKPSKTITVQVDGLQRNVEQSMKTTQPMSVLQRGVYDIRWPRDKP